MKEGRGRGWRKNRETAGFFFPLPASIPFLFLDKSPSNWVTATQAYTLNLKKQHHKHQINLCYSLGVG